MDQSWKVYFILDENLNNQTFYKDHFQNNTSDVQFCHLATPALNLRDITFGVLDYWEIFTSLSRCYKF